MTALFGVALIALIWTWTRSLFGRSAGWLAAGLAAMSPTLLAHGGLATSDIVLSCCLLGALSAFWQLWHRITWWRFALASLATGAALLAKVSGVLLVPMLAVLLVVRCMGRTPLRVRLGARNRRVTARASRVALLAGTFGAVGLFATAMIWTAYEFRFEPQRSPAQPGLTFDPSWETLLHGDCAAQPTKAVTGALLIESGFKSAPPPIFAHAVSWCRDHRVLPEAYLWSVAFTFQASRTRPSFFWGKASTTGSVWFFPAAFLLKTTPPELLLITLGLAGAVVFGAFRTTAPRPRNRCRALLYRSVPLLVLFVLYGLVAINTPLNIGHRHLLPIYPVVFVFAGAAALWLRGGHRLIAASILVALCGWQIIESGRVRPFYLSYFTPSIGDAGWRHFVDSSYDWGQGLPALKQWIEAKRATGDTAPVFLSYFGSDSPRARGLPVIRVADWRDDSGPRNYPAPLRGGWYAISATNFQRIYLGIPGPWPQYEARYREIAAALPSDQAKAARLTEAERAEWLHNAMLFEILQFGRLCHALREREPDAIVGSSILIFQLSDEEVSTALTAPLEKITGRRLVGSAPN
ncbi:MAG: glycosyltransferase family 39 protein [Opitutaceae bacterium]